MHTDILGENISLLQMAVINENRGKLFPIHFSDIPFQPKRMFVIADVPIGTERGGHAHRLQAQLMICLNGKVEICARIDNESTKVMLEQPTQGLLVSPTVWTMQKFLEPDSRLLVFSSGEYDRDDYIVD
jgi:rRNA maturation protein Rpf1